jgi:hypothetical protein
MFTVRAGGDNEVIVSGVGIAASRWRMVAVRAGSDEVVGGSRGGFSGCPVQ